MEVRLPEMVSERLRWLEPASRCPNPAGPVTLRRRYRRRTAARYQFFHSRRCRIANNLVKRNPCSLASLAEGRIVTPCAEKLCPASAI
jgi:hypothetical protein